MSVSEYAKKFKHLGRFHTLRMAKDWQCRKFENGLRGDLKLMVAPLSIKEFPALVEKARVMEKLKAEVEAQQRSQQKVGDHLGPQADRTIGESLTPDLRLRGPGDFHLSLISTSLLSITLTGLGVFIVEGLI